MVTEGRQGNIVVMHKEKLEKERNIITDKKFMKDEHNIKKNIAEVIRDNEELNVTIKRIIENGMKDDNDIVNMLNNMVIGGKEKIDKLLNMHRAAEAPKSRAEITPIKSGSEGCNTAPLRPKGPFPRGGARAAQRGEHAMLASESNECDDCDFFPKHDGANNGEAYERRSFST